MKRILTSAELYDVARAETEREDSVYRTNCVCFCNWLMDLFIYDRYTTLHSLEQKYFSKDEWLEYIKENF